MSAFTTVNPAGVVAANGQPMHSPPVSNEGQEPEPELEDDKSLVGEPHNDDSLMQVDEAGHDEQDGQEPNSKKRKRYNDPPNEVHAELRRPERPGQWYSKSPEQWEELSHLHKLIYSHVGRIEETDLGEEVDPCEACRKRGFKCMKYKQDHPEVEKLYKGNVRVGTSCTRCRRYRRTCATLHPNNIKPNGTSQTPQKTTPKTNGSADIGLGLDGSYKRPTSFPERDLDTWENTLLAAASGGSPLTSVASSPILPDMPESLYAPPPPMPALVRPAERDISHPEPHDDYVSAPAQIPRTNNYHDKTRALYTENLDLRADRAEFIKERRDWKDEKRDLMAEIYHLREDQRKTREENWALQSKVLELEKEALAAKSRDVDRTMAEAELRVENRQLIARIDVLSAQRRGQKAKVKDLKRSKRDLRKQMHALSRGSAPSTPIIPAQAAPSSDPIQGTSATLSATSTMPPPPPATTSTMDLVET